MKHNELTMDYDGICIFITTIIKTPLTGKLILAFLNTVLISLLIFALIVPIPALAVTFAAILFFMVKYTLWNFYGKERLIINTKTIAYQHDYGFFRTAYMTKKIGRTLRMDSVDVFQSGKPDQLRLLFFSHNDDDLPEEIYRMALPISAKDAEIIMVGVNVLFTDKMTDDYSLPPLHLN